jgi:hypothetical protein
MGKKLVVLQPSSRNAPSSTTYDLPSGIAPTSGKTFGRILAKPIPIGFIGPGPAID